MSTCPVFVGPVTNTICLICALCMYQVDTSFMTFQFSYNCNISHHVTVMQLNNIVGMSDLIEIYAQVWGVQA